MIRNTVNLLLTTISVPTWSMPSFPTAASYPTRPIGGSGSDRMTDPRDTAGHAGPHGPAARRPNTRLPRYFALKKSDRTESDG
jgi:hypothetical protein